MKCRFCWMAQIDGYTGELQCNATGENKSYEEASLQRDCEHYVLCECGDQNYQDFYMEEIYNPEVDEFKPVHKDQIILELGGQT